MAAFEIRAVQLDLARQMETLDWIRQFIDFASSFGYNALHLYLEGRIRTESFPYRDPEFSYTADDMRLIVDYATSKGMDVQPQVNCFGHAEHFMRCPEVAHLGELRNGTVGRFGSGDMHVFCPSLEETYEFLGNYLAEVAALFPGEFFHVGCDEVWQMGYCPECRARLAAGETLDDIFAKHITRLHDIVTNRCGKRMMMWDDMWEEFPEAVADVPNDIIQCVWQYDNVADLTQTHFGRRRRDHRLARYAELGMESLICPVTWNIRNTATLTQYAKAFNIRGGLMTIWELSNAFLYAQYPTVAFAGRRWADLDVPNCDIFRGVLKDLLGIDDELTRAALLAMQSRRFQRGTRAPEAELHGPITQAEWDGWQDVAVCRAALAPLAERVTTSPGAEVVEDLLTQLDQTLVSCQVRQVALDAYRRWTDRPAPPPATLAARGDAVVRAIQTLRARRQEQWERWRPGLQHESGGEIFSTWEAGVADFVARVKADCRRPGLLRVRYALPDYYGSQQGCWLVQYADGDGWEKLTAGSPKPRGSIADEVPLYWVEYPLPPGREPVRLRFETSGYGGLGIAFVEALAGGRWHVPTRVVATDGKVRDADKTLRDDSYWCMLGEEDTEYAFHHPAVAEAVHAIEFDLTAKPLPWNEGKN